MFLYEHPEIEESLHNYTSFVAGGVVKKAVGGAVLEKINDKMVKEGDKLGLLFKEKGAKKIAKDIVDKKWEAINEKIDVRRGVVGGGGRVAQTRAQPPPPRPAAL